MSPGANPSIDEALLKRALPQFPGLGYWGRIVRNGLSINTPACLFETSAGPWFAKLEPLAGRSLDSFRQEHALIRHAAAQGLPLPAVRTTRDGDSLWVEPGHALVITGVAPGEDRYGHEPVFAPFHTLAETEEAGRCLARLHQAWSDLPLPEPRPWQGMSAQCRFVGSTSAEAVVQGWMAAQPVLAARLQASAADRFIPYLAERLPALRAAHGDWPVGIIHGDFIKRNLFWQGYRISAVIDFGLWNVGPWLLDLALALLPCGFDWPSLLQGGEGLRPDHLQGMLRGYETVRPLTVGERQGLPVLMEVARLEFYLGIVAQAEELGRHEEAERFWGLLAGMMTWFSAHPEWPSALTQRADPGPA